MTPGSQARVLITGATGRIGRIVIDLLCKADAPTRALIHDKDPAVAFPPGVDVVAGDLTAPESLETALNGVETVFLVWSAPPATAAAVVERLAAHARRVVFLSAPYRTPHPFFEQPNPMATLYAEIERLIADTGLESTVIRPGMFASNSLMWWADAIRVGTVVRWPYAAAETAPVDDRDVAEVIAHTLRYELPADSDFVLTGPESLSQVDQVRLIGEVIGRPLRYQELTPDEFRAATPERARPAADMLLAAWRATIGHRAYVTTTITDVLGRPARTFREWATDHTMSFIGEANRPT